MEFVIASLVAFLAALAVYSFRPLPAGYWAGRVDAAYAEGQEKQLPFYRGLLAGFGPLVKYTPVGWLKAIEGQVYWCQLGGKWVGWSVTEVTALHLAAVVGGGVLALVGFGADPLGLMLMAAAPFLLNMMYLRSPARRVRRQLASELPEFVSILAAEVASETSLQEALLRVARGPGMCAAWFRRAAQQAVGKSLFTQGGQTGALLNEARQASDRDLINLARTLDNIQKRGTGTKELLGQVARDTAARFVGAATMRAEKVGSDIILPMIFFFFFPFIVVVMTVMAAPLFVGGGIF